MEIKDTLIQILQTSTDPSEILNSLKESCGEEGANKLIDAVKKSTSKTNRTAGKEKYIMDKRQQVADLLAKVEDDLSSIFEDLPEDETVRLDLKATVSSKETDGKKLSSSQVLAKTNHDVTKKLLITNSGGEDVNKEIFANFGKKPYKSKSNS